MLITKYIGINQKGHYFQGLTLGQFLMLKTDPSTLFDELATDLCKTKIALIEKVYGFSEGYVMKHLTKEFWGIGENI